jgi:hypothetical protein
MSDLGIALHRHAELGAWRRIASQPALAELIFFPSRYLHASWRARLFPEGTGDMVWSCAMAHGYLSRYVERMLELPHPDISNVDHAAWHIALWPADQLHRLVLHTGAVATSADIRLAMGRASVKLILEQIGGDLYNFALQRGPLIYAQTLMDRAPAPSNDLSDIGARVRLAGQDLLQRYISKCDRALWSRVRLKLPHVPDHALEKYANAMDDAEVQRIVPRMVKEIT